MEPQLELQTAQLASRRWRLNHLYHCSDKQGRIVPFRLNWAQAALLDELHENNLILKARQIGFSTLIQLFLLDAALFNSNLRCGVICHRLDDSRSILRDKIKLPYSLLPDVLRAARPIVRDSADEVAFGNNSSIRVGTTMRGATLNLLHVSELGQICSRSPDKAAEVVSGSLNTLAPGMMTFLESTADGNAGFFFEMCESSQARQRMGTPLSPMDFRFHFYPWWRCDDYRLAPAGVVIDAPMAEYFDGLEKNHGIVLSPEQKAWYCKKHSIMAGEMRREFPSTPAESFEASISGAYYADQMARAELQKRIGSFPAEPGFPVHTAWDIGVSDQTAVWLFQLFPSRIRVVDYFEAAGEGMEFYLDVLGNKARENGWKYGRHLFPHDAKVREWGTGLTRIEQTLRGLKQRGLGKVELVPLANVADGINAVRILLDRCEFDEAACAVGIRHLKLYRKDWNEAAECWRDRPRHDSASHGADAFRYLAMAYKDIPVEPLPYTGPRDPRGKPLVLSPFSGETLSARGRSTMTWDTFHRLTGTTLDGRDRQIKRI
jgi:hypothetical protein